MRKKGFTLIELLAVIIILAILMIIAVPNILSTLATARQEAFLSQAKSIYKSAQQQFMLDSMTGLGNTCYDKSNLDLGSISDTVSFVVSVDEEDGSINNITVMDSGQGLKAFGTDINGISLENYTEGSVSCSGYSVPYKEKLLHGSDPILGNGMIPVKLASTGSSWAVTYADTTKRWYKYGSSQWANAVILVSSPSKEYAVGDTIEHSDIQGYFVWIPKYKYRLFNMGNYEAPEDSDSLPSANRLIEIEFGIENTVDTDTSCATPMTSKTSGNCVIDKWMSHPSFISFNKNGFWVGKFEVTGTTSSLTTLPGISPLAYQTVKVLFESAYNYNRILDSHMIKNTEWGAVAYLAHSKYGMGNKNIYINNYYSNGYKTGCVGNGPNAEQSSLCQNQWYTSVGFNGSTTGNITGIYDMSGGADEYVAAHWYNSYGSSGFDDDSISSYLQKYFDVYDITSKWNKYDCRILGDATSEMGPIKSNFKNSWYNDVSYSVSSSQPWFRRGGTSSSGDKDGLFRFDNLPGEARDFLSSRLVFTP